MMVGAGACAAPGAEAMLARRGALLAAAGTLARPRPAHAATPGSGGGESGGACALQRRERGGYSFVVPEKAWAQQKARGVQELWASEETEGWCVSTARALASA